MPDAPTTDTPAPDAPPAPPAAATPLPAPAAPPATGDTAEPDWKAEAEKWKALARKHEDQAKRTMDEVRRSTMTDHERAVDEAKATARAETIGEFGARLVDAEIRAQMAGRVDDARMGVLLQAVNRKAFLHDDGTVDTTSVKTFVDGIAPASQPVFPDLGQGARNGAGQYGLGNDNALLRDAMAKLGITR